MSKPDKLERCRLANEASVHLPYSPTFFFEEERLCMTWLVVGYQCSVPVRITKLGTLKRLGHLYPWHINQGLILARLAKWIRTGKIEISAKDWEDAFPGNPIWLGRKKFLAAIKKNIYGIEEDRQAIFAEFRAGAKMQDLAAKYGMELASVEAIVRAAGRKP